MFPPALPLPRPLERARHPEHAPCHPERSEGSHRPTTPRHPERSEGSRPSRLLALLSLPALAALAIAVACGGSSSADDDFPRVVTLGDGSVFPAIVNDSVTVGENRLLLQLTGADDEQIFDASVHLSLYDLTAEEPRLHGEADARFVPIELGYIDEQSGGVLETTGSGGAYAAPANFDRAGEWGAKVDVQYDGERFEDIPFRFTVAERSAEPMIGDPAPPSRQMILADGAAIEDIDSSSPPRPQMHDTTIADAVESGRPAVIAFATPAFCTSRVCAPVMDTVMDPLFDRYGNQAAFIHVEPNVLRDLRAGFIENPVPATREWDVRSEPWIFVVDGDGRIAAKFQGIIALDEVEAALRRALESPPAP